MTVRIVERLLTSSIKSIRTTGRTAYTPKQRQSTAFPNLASLQRTSLSSALRGRLGLSKPFKENAPLKHLHSSKQQRSDNSTFNASPLSESSNMGAIATGRVNTQNRVKKLRELMKENNVTAYVIPSEDAHASEYPDPSDQRRAFISGFNGSAGTAVVDVQSAALFTDGRYFQQAGLQLEPGVWTLMKQGEPNVPTWQEYLVKDLPSQSKIGIDPSIIGVGDGRALATELAKVGSSLVPITQNLVDKVWGEERPAPPQRPIYVLDEKYSGRSAASKLEELRKDVKRKGAEVQGVVANMLDEVAWLFNLRGSDITITPLFFSFALITLDRAYLYCHVDKLEDSARSYISKDVEVRPYDSFYQDLNKFGKALQDGQKILVPRSASLAVQEALGGADKVLVDRSIIIDQRGIKNETEIQGFRDSHVRDGVALASYFAWLEEQLAQGNKVTEYEGSVQLEKFRAVHKEFRGSSFPAISSSGSNAAVIHYSPDPEKSLVIDPNEMYLCDSGGQYIDGTTDVTRTWHFRTPDAEQIRAFTRVLQGHIAIDRAVFQAGTTGYQLDCLARRPLWGEGWDFRHGVGHGVGHFLSVHEPAQGISTRAVHNETALKDGMVLSNEPGFYKDNHWGIRIENLSVVRKAKTPNSFGSKGYLGFEHLTLCPYQRTLIDGDLLDKQERDWINAYHDETLAKVGPALQQIGDQRGYDWLKRHCSERV